MFIVTLGDQNEASTELVGIRKNLKEAKKLMKKDYLKFISQYCTGSGMDKHCYERALGKRHAQLYVHDDNTYYWDILRGKEV